MLLNVSGPSDLGLFEVNEAAEIVAKAAHPDANIIFGAVIDDSLGDEVRITVIAAGLRPLRGRERRPRGLTSLGLDDDDDLGDGIDFSVGQRRRAATATTSSTSPSSCADRAHRCADRGTIDRAGPRRVRVHRPARRRVRRRRTTPRNLGDHVGDDPDAVAREPAPASRAAPCGRGRSRRGGCGSARCTAPTVVTRRRAARGSRPRPTPRSPRPSACRSWSSPPTARRSRSSRDGAVGGGARGLARTRARA